MARAGGTQIALRTTVMIGALLLLLLMALLPGPVKWLLGSQHEPAADRDELARTPRSEAVVSHPIPDAAGSGRGAAFGETGAGAPTGVAGSEMASADAPPQGLDENTLVSGPTGPADEFSGRYREITSKLRELGAAYHRLETWEGETTVYRFQCALSAASTGDGEGDYRTFEATGTRPADAMERVLADVRAWRNGALY